MKFTNTNIQFLYNWLNVPLHGTQSRARNRFIKLIDKQYKNSIDTRKEILEKYAKKDDAGKVILKEGLYDISDEDIEKAKEELNVFLDKSVSYKLTKADIKDVKEIVSILNNSKVGHDIVQGEIYEQIMSELEAVK